MPRVAAQPPKKRRYCRTEFHPDAEEYLSDLADDVGVQIAYIIRLCVQQALPDIEAKLRAGELPEDELKRPTKPLKTTLRKPKQIPETSRLDPPPIADFLETGEMPPVPLALPVSAEPPPLPESREDPQAPERPADPPAEGLSGEDCPAVDPTPTPDPLQQKLRRVGKMRRG